MGVERIGLHLRLAMTKDKFSKLTDHLFFWMVKKIGVILFLLNNTKKKKKKVYFEGKAGIL